MLYGEKYIGFQKLAKIRKLVLLEDTVSRVEAIKLVYTLADSGKGRKMTLDEKLLSLNLSTDNTSLSNISFTDNDSTPSFLFMLGLLIGDGSLFLRLRLVPKSSSIWVIPMLSLYQLDTPLNENLFNKLYLLFNSMGITYTVSRNIINTKHDLMIEEEEDENEVSAAIRGGFRIRKKDSTMKYLVVQGIDNIINKLVPQFILYKHLFYWKYPQYEILIRTSKLIQEGAHLTKLGQIKIIEICYNYSNKRMIEKEAWISKIELMFKAKESQSISGHQMIEPVRDTRKDEGLAGGLVGWRVVLPKSISLKLPTKNFYFTNYRGASHSQDALYAAIDYRDKTIRDWIESILV